MSYSKPESYRPAICCWNCKHCEDVNRSSSLNDYELRCRFGLEVGQIAGRDREVEPHFVCDEFVDEPWDTRYSSCYPKS